MATSTSQNSFLASQARECFTDHAAKVLPVLAKAILEKLSELVDQPASAPLMQTRRDSWLAYQANGKAWINGTGQAWRSARLPTTHSAASTVDPLNGNFSLIDDNVVEERIIASRLALRLQDITSWELNDLRLRVQGLEGSTDLSANDILRPEVLARLMIEQWTAAGLSRDVWNSVQGAVQGRLAGHLLEAYHLTNAFLIQQGVMVEIDLRALVKRTPSPVSAASVSSPAVRQAMENRAQGSSGVATDGGGGGQFFGNRGQGGGANGTGAGAASSSGGAGGGGGGSSGQYSDNRGQVSSANSPGGKGSSFSGGSGGSGSGNGGGSSGSGGGSDYQRRSPSAKQVDSPHDETRMQTATTPLARARMRAQGVIGTLKRFLTNQVAGFDDTRGAQASPQLASALAGMRAPQRDEDEGFDSLAMQGVQVYGDAHVERATAQLRQRTSALKQAASTSTEKATIEIVALMFQAILAEDRIPPAVRVWFARLQMPVLRVAIAEPEFFGTLEHPARQLIDRMGSCVLGFDVAVTGNAMELEIMRIVQVIEQYPETGRRVFQLVYDEFQKFLSKYLSENGIAARVVSIAQQVEQKETMAIQYTIEMRNMLNNLPVREVIREFLFKVWAEVLAIASMRNGPQHEQTLALKRASTDLVWAASAKPNRADRAKVIADLPKLLLLLRTGMTMLALDAAAQDQHIKVISDTLADAFMSKTDAVSAQQINEMAKRLVNLEDYLSDEDFGDLPIDTEALVMMIGIDAADIEVVTDGGSQPTEAMKSWAQELQLGAWFSLDHNGRVSHVQFAWRSDRKQLHLFASSDAHYCLIQARRLAAYLQAGLLVPTEEEALTVRATRDALAKLEANPERLLG